MIYMYYLFNEGGMIIILLLQWSHAYWGSSSFVQGHRDRK